MIGFLYNYVIRIVKIGGNNDMAKFVKGAYDTISEVHTALEELKEEGYTKKNIKLVTDGDKTYEDLKSATNTEVEKEDGTVKNKDTWDNIIFDFPLLSSQDYSNNVISPVPDPDSEIDEEGSLLKGYKKELDQGKIIVIVDDILNKQASFNLDKIDENSETPKDNMTTKEVLEKTPEQDSHPDTNEMDEVLEQETTYVPGDEARHSDK